MKRYIKYFALIAAASSVFGACADSPAGVEIQRQDDVVIGDGTTTYTLPVTGPNGEDMAFQYITPQGGKLAVAGHEMIVPPGAVPSPTWFMMSVLASDRIQVNLKAWRASDRAPVTQFAASTPIRLKLNVSRVTGIDVSRLLVVYLPDETIHGRKEPVQSSVNADTKVLTGYLTHFSMYAAGAREYTVGVD